MRPASDSGLFHGVPWSEVVHLIKRARLAPTFRGAPVRFLANTFIVALCQWLSLAIRE